MSEKNWMLPPDAACFFLMLLDLPFDITDDILSFFLVEWFDDDARLLATVSLDKARIGAIPNRRCLLNNYSGWNYVSCSNLLVTCCYLEINGF